MVDPRKVLLKAAAMPHFDRITQNPLVMGGKPCIRGQRVTVGMIVGQIGAGRTIGELLKDYPDIPAYTLVDLNIGYDVGPWTARLIVSNIFDEKYFINNYQTLFYGNVPGTPTNFSLSVRRTF